MDNASYSDKIIYDRQITPPFISITAFMVSGAYIFIVLKAFAYSWFTRENSSRNVQHYPKKIDGGFYHQFDWAIIRRRRKKKKLVQYVCVRVLEVTFVGYIKWVSYSNQIFFMHIRVKISIVDYLHNVLEFFTNISCSTSISKWFVIIHYYNWLFIYISLLLICLFKELLTWIWGGCRLSASFG